MSAECVGFVECPCVKCRRTRVESTEAHPHHAQPDAAYCGACRTAKLRAYDDVRRMRTS